ncbi:MAG: aldehyde dehydrogenase family protein, partial [Deltaproteobacteria bacterium]|nr:aldehyde dehydrogenase family protein [Deltaproteobacteria bacterium]
MARTVRNATMGAMQAQTRFFQTGITRDVEFRIRQLKKMRELLADHEADIYRVLREDLGKPEFEVYIGELGILLEETKFIFKHLKRWAKPQKVSLSMAHWPAKGLVTREPYGVALILGAWNYPIQLVLGPMMGAMAAGNCAVLKPSEMAPHTAALLHRMISENFPEEYLLVVEGGVEATQKLLEESFDYIFFTGSPRVGKIVMEAAARHLTPLTLELGGKSPCIVDASASLDTAARRIIWGKFMNSGQTCVAPDYLLVQKKVAGPLIEKMRQAITDFYGDDPQKSPDYARIINAA